MAASVGMILDAAVKYERSAETQPQYPEETAEGAHAPVSSSSPVEGSHVRDKEPMDDQSTDTSGASVPSQLEQNVVSAAEKATEDSPSSPHALVISAPEADIASVSRPKKSTPSGAKSKKAKNVLGIVGPKKKKLKKKLEHKHPSIGLCVDALDRNMVWGNGRIIDINVAEEKVKITFQGYNSNWDIWTDLLSIRPHGNMAWPQRGLNAKSWDGRSNLFTGEPLVDSVYNDRSVSAPPPSQPASFEKRIAQAPATKTAGPKSVKREAAQKLKPNDIRVAEPKKASEARKRKRVVRDESPKGSSRGPSTPWSDPEAVRTRNSNNALTDGSSAFLVRCAEVWKKQLQSMTDIVVSR